MKKRILISISVIVGIMAFASVIWSSKTYMPQDLAKKALLSDKYVTVTDSDYISFTPKENNTKKGFIFYPGGGVSPDAYAPICREIAENGYTVVIAKMPLNLAVLSPNEADKIIKAYPDIDTWAIGGHSLGGVMASKYASENDKIEGVVFYASYPASDEIKDSDIKAVSIYGDKDSVVNQEKLKESKDNLPKNSEFIEIDGANHSQFGDYGLQKGDSKATIDENKQIEISVDKTIDLLEGIN